MEPVGTCVPSNFGESGDQVYLVPSNFSAATPPMSTVVIDFQQQQRGWRKRRPRRGFDTIVPILQADSVWAISAVITMQPQLTGTYFPTGRN